MQLFEVGVHPPSLFYGALLQKRQHRVLHLLALLQIHAVQGIKPTLLRWRRLWQPRLMLRLMLKRRRRRCWLVVHPTPVRVGADVQRAGRGGGQTPAVVAVGAAVRTRPPRRQTANTPNTPNTANIPDTADTVVVVDGVVVWWRGNIVDDRAQ